MPTVAGIPGGGFGVAWWGYPSSMECSYVQSAFLRFFDEAGSASSEPLLVDAGVGWVDDLQVGVAGSKLHVAWNRYTPEGVECFSLSEMGDADVFSRMFDFPGKIATFPWQVNVMGEGDQLVSQVLSLSDSSIWVIWVSFPGVTSNFWTTTGRVMARKCSLGGPCPAEFFVDGGCPDNVVAPEPLYDGPAAAQLASGDVVVTWVAKKTTALGCELVAPKLVGRILEPDGTPVTEEFLIPSPVDACFFDQETGVASSSDGGFVVAYSAYPCQSLPWLPGHNVYLSHLGPLGEWAGPVGQANALDQHIPWWPRLTNLQGGGMAVTWQNEDEYGHSSLRARVRFPDGSFSGVEQSPQSSPGPGPWSADGDYGVAPLDSGAFIMVWDQSVENQSSALFGQRFGPDGKKLYH